MLPLRDINPVRTRPVINYALIAANVAFFLFVATLPRSAVSELAVVPARFAQSPVAESFTIFTSMFMHAGLGHIGGNMLFLWIFGDNIEDALGHARYLFFYLTGGVVAAFSQILLSSGSLVPIVGASGAIAAVTGAYVVLHPRAPILMLNPFPPLWLFLGITFVVPAWFVVGEFFDRSRGASRIDRTNPDLLKSGRKMTGKTWVT